MTGKPKILRELEGLPEDVLKEIEEFIISLKRNKRKGQPSLHNGKMLAKRQFAAIKKWAGKDLGQGFSGKEHDSVLYGGGRRYPLIPGKG